MEFKLDQAISVLSRTPQALRTLLSGLADPWIWNNEGPETWSPYDVVGHLLYGEKTDWIPRLKIILHYGKGKTFEPFDRFAMFRESEGKSIDDLLDEFGRLRMDNLATLQQLKLGSQDFLRQGMHPGLGEVNLGQMLATWVVHDLSHLAQIAEIMARQYREQVGPWKAYLRVLQSDE